MKSKITLLLILVILLNITLFSQEQGAGRGQNQDETPAMDKTTPEIPGVVKAGTKIEIIKDGLRGSDGGVGMPDGSVLVSTNNTIIQVDAKGNATTLVENSEQAAGLALDPKGRIIAAQYSGKVSVVYPKGSEKLLTDRFDGKPYIRPNDLVIDKKGGIYFTDCYQIGAKKSPDDLPQAVYYITPANNKVVRVVDDVARPNGITLSPDEKILYVNDWDGAYLVAYDVQPDGSLKNRRNFARYDVEQKTDHGMVSGADGLCIDNAGHTFATTPAGIQVFDAKGGHLGNIDAPYSRPPQNCGFAGPGKAYLYVMGRGVVFRIQTLGTGVTTRAK